MPTPKPGDYIRIKSGPFASFVSIVESIDTTREMLIAEVEIFGRATPIEIAFTEIEDIDPQGKPRLPLRSLN